MAPSSSPQLSPGCNAVLHGIVAFLLTSLLLQKRLAREWIDTNLVAFNNNQFMYEKYDALNPGHGGGGGEYKPQKGFGWTNGVVLDLLVSYPSLFQ